MTKRMLIDATHPEETRVAVVNGTKLEEFDYETEFRKQLKGNIYLAKVTRVEPSLQAAFVEYGGNRHAFLPFPEIHADYYHIPVSDRSRHEWSPQVSESRKEDEAGTAGQDDGGGSEEEGEWHGATPAMLEPHNPDVISEAFETVRQKFEQDSDSPDDLTDDTAEPDGDFPEAHGYEPAESHNGLSSSDEDPFSSEQPEADSPPSSNYDPFGDHGDTLAPPPEAEGDSQGGEVSHTEYTETVGGDEVDEIRHSRRSVMPRYKIQEVIKRRQIMLIQVSKEERGNKGAAITTFLSLPGRYCVLMPNTPRGGGVSRKIANPQDRKRLKDLLGDLDLPEGMSVILRTAGVERTRPEIKRDLDYLMRLWEAIRTLTLKSTAPALVYEEGNLVKRSVRDIYSRDIDELVVAGEAGFRQAKDFMRMLMPSHAKRVQFYRDPVPLFLRFQVESQIDAIHSPVAQLRSGGYVVIDQTEALVSIDVNSGRSTRERNIEETAYKTNLEAADEIARQLRLRDMGGLVVVDFIDMEDPRHDAAVERRLKEAMKNDRARIQIGRMSPFGLLELSRQRLHPSLIESSFHTCPTCRGIGLVRSTESAAFMAMRAMEEEAIKSRAAEIVLHVPAPVALYILNHKRGLLADLELRYEMRAIVDADDTLISPDLRVERLRAHPPGYTPPALLQQLPQPVVEGFDEDGDEADEGEEGASAVSDDQDAAGGEAGAQDRSRRRRRRRGRRRGQFGVDEEIEQSGEPEQDQEGGDVRDDGEPQVSPFQGNSEQPEAEFPPVDIEHQGGRTERPGRRRRGRRPPRGAAETIDTTESASLAFEQGEAGNGEILIEAEENTKGQETEPVSVPPGEASEPELALSETAAPASEPETATASLETSKDFETVNQAPETPRNGWWKRLIQ